jgi:DNA (cytosine-5)-methyltransferase 1
MGYYRAGFEVVGVDIEPQPRYPFEFIQADGLEVIAEHGHEYDVIHASPLCQPFTLLNNLPNVIKEYPDQIKPTRNILKQSGKPYVIENVPGSPLVNPLMLCGSMFPGLRVYRHRLFECNPPIYFPPATCNHSYKMPPSKGVYHTLNGYEFITCAGNHFEAESGRIAMNIDWMTRAELSQAIPPAYTEWLGKQLIKICFNSHSHPIPYKPANE